MKTLMKKMAISFVMASILVTACNNELEEDLVVDNTDQPAEDGQEIQGKYIVVFKDNAIASGRSRGARFTNREDKAAYSNRVKDEVTAKARSFFRRADIGEENIERFYTSAFSGALVNLTEEEAQKMADDPNVASVELDKKVILPPPVFIPVDTLVLNLQTKTCAINNEGGFQDGSGKNTWIWVVDTGIDLDHPDLNVQTNTTFAKAFVDSSPDDALGHGTHVAGIAAAKNNLFGVVGVSAGARVVPVDVFGGAGTSATSTILAGINHVSMYDIPGDVMNLSLGGYAGPSCATTSAYISAINSVAGAGTHVALAAGNDKSQASLYQPACLAGANIYTVASMNCNKTFSASFTCNPAYGSNKGSYWSGGPIDYITTGNSVYSTYKNGGYATLCGTSMASPVVAGILHAKNGAPAFGGWVPHAGDWYRIAKL